MELKKEDGGKVKNLIKSEGEELEFSISDNTAYIIMQSLTDIYSDPIGTLIRETASNADDAHKERQLKQNGKRPLEKGEDLSWFSDRLTFEVSYIPKSAFLESTDIIQFKDWGVGLSDNRLKKVFVVFGASTKRVDNTEMGGFGLGCKSPLAYTPIFYIKNRYNGKISTYKISLNDSGAIILSTISHESTEEKNGLTVLIPLKDESDRNLFIEKFSQQLRYFNNIVYKGLDDVLEEVKSKNIVYFTDNYFIDTGNRDVFGVLIGNVRYPLYNFETEIARYLEKPYNNYSFLKNSGFHLKFKVGDLSITPSRENIKYDNRTKEKIIAGIKRFFDDIVENFSKTLVDLKDLDYYTYYFKYVYKKKKSYGDSSWELEENLTSLEGKDREIYLYNAIFGSNYQYAIKKLGKCKLNENFDEKLKAIGFLSSLSFKFYKISRPNESEHEWVVDRDERATYEGILYFIYEARLHPDTDTFLIVDDNNKDLNKIKELSYFKNNPNKDKFHVLKIFGPRKNSSSDTDYVKKLFKNFFNFLLKSDDFENIKNYSSIKEEESYANKVYSDYRAWKKAQAKDGKNVKDLESDKNIFVRKLEGIDYYSNRRRNNDIGDFGVWRNESVSDTGIISKVFGFNNDADKLAFYSILLNSTSDILKVSQKKKTLMLEAESTYIDDILIKDEIKDLVKVIYTIENKFNLSVFDNFGIFKHFITINKSIHFKYEYIMEKIKIHTEIVDPKNKKEIRQFIENFYLDVEKSDKSKEKLYDENFIKYTEELKEYLKGLDLLLNNYESTLFATIFDRSARDEETFNDSLREYLILKGKKVDNYIKVDKPKDKKKKKLLGTIKIKNKLRKYRYDAK